MRGAVAILVVALLTPAFGGPALVAGLLDRSGQLSHRIARAWARLVLWGFGVRVCVSGVENLVAGPAVYAANHTSALDIPVVFGHLPLDFRIIHKRSLYFVPFIGWQLFLGGHIGIDRGKAFRARRSLAAAARRIEGGTSVVVFPEGTRGPGPVVQAFKRGSFVLAQEAGVPVVPLSLVGVKDLVPRGILSLRPGTVSIRIHPAVQSTGRDPDVLALEVQGRVAEGCDAGAA